jgi:REP element-mobilizing transposase RayT
LKDWDYASPGAYFVTICAKDRRHMFGVITGEEIYLSPAGLIIDKVWLSLTERYEHVRLDEYVIMPNHMHGIIVLQSVRRGGSRTAPTTSRKPLGRLIGAFKTISTKQINRMHSTPGKRLWQRSFYDPVSAGRTATSSAVRTICGASGPTSATTRSTGLSTHTTPGIDETRAGATDRSPPPVPTLVPGPAGFPDRPSSTTASPDRNGYQRMLTRRMICSCEPG